MKLAGNMLLDSYCILFLLSAMIVLQKTPNLFCTTCLQSNIGVAPTLSDSLYEPISMMAH